MRRNLNAGLAAAVAAAALVLGSCATQPPAPTASESAPTPSPTPTPSLSATPTPTPSETATPSVSATPTPSPTKAGAVLLAGNGIAGQEFGTAEATVEKRLAATLGKPDESIEGILCELNPSSPWQRTVIYDGLSVLFVANSSAESAPRTLNGWALGLEGSRPAVQMEDDVPLNLSFAQLVKKYPKGTLEETGLGDGSQIFTLPNGIRFLGVDVPDLVMGGEVHYCE